MVYGILSDSVDNHDDHHKEGHAEDGDCGAFWGIICMVSVSDAVAQPELAR